MEYIRFIFLGLFGGVSVVHLYHSWIDAHKKRCYTKPFLLIFILLYYIFSTDKASIVLIAALLTSWLGDVLLMGKGDKWFTAGGISFMLSHFLFIAVYVLNLFTKPLEGVIWWVVIPVAILYYTVSLLIIRAIKPTTPKAMVVPMYIYLLCNSTMNVFSLIQLMSFRSPGAVLAYIGAILFFISDCTLYLARYYKKKDIIFKRHFTVMFTYILGEFLIAQGVLMLGTHII